MKAQNLLGKRFSMLTVSSPAPGRRGQRMWNCLCDCGNTIVQSTSMLNIGNAKSCGCYSRNLFVKSVTKHSLYKSKEYLAYNMMKTRCYYKKGSSYQNYGGRGIKVCERWLSSFENFIADMGFAPTKNHSLERISVNGNYEPSNCKWATRKEQANNTRRNHFINYNGTKKTMAQWAEELGLSYKAFSSRINRGWSINDAITTPPMQ